MHKPATLHDIAAALRPHGKVALCMGILRFNGAQVAYRMNGAIVLASMDRGGGNIMAAKTTHASAETIAADILWRVSECKVAA